MYQLFHIFQYWNNPAWEVFVELDKSHTSHSENRLFARLQAQLEVIIHATPPGERLVSEPELARQLGVSRATLREAMRSFEAQGLIRRRQGVGTFVVGPKAVIETGLEVLESIETQAKRIGLDVSMGTLSIQKMDADLTRAEQLQVSVGAPIVQISRTIYAGGRPVAYLVDTLPVEFLEPEDLRQGFTGSVLDHLLRRGSPELETSVAEIRTITAPSEIARSLEIQRGDALLLLQSRLYDVDGRIVDYSHSYFIPGHFRFQVVRRVGGLGKG